MKRIIIIGASSGLGRRVALDFAAAGWQVGIAARREDNLRKIQEIYPENIVYYTIDVTADNAQERFKSLIELNGGMDYCLYTAGCGWQNVDLDSAKDMQTLQVNVLGFTRIITEAYKYYKNNPSKTACHIAAITSVAGCKGLGISATYSASKRYQWTFLQAIEQLAHRQKVNVKITDIRPGFTDTDLLSKNEKYPILMSVDHVAPLIERAVERAPRIKVVDGRWAVLNALWSLIPNWLWKRIWFDT